MAKRKTVRAHALAPAAALGALLATAAAGEAAAQACCTPPPPPPPPCCAPPPPPPCCDGSTNVNVNVTNRVVVNANANASVQGSARAGAGAGVVYYGSGGYTGHYSPPMATGTVQLNVLGARRSSYEAERTRTRRVVIRAVCMDARETPHPASQVRPGRDVLENYDGELYRCIAGSRLQVTIADYNGEIDVTGGETLACKAGEALYHAPGGLVSCRPQARARDCNERSLLRRFGAGVKILTITSRERYTAWREEQESTTSAMTLDGGVGGVAY